jgi:hypothetical protein
VDAITPVVRTDFGMSRYARVAQIEAAQRVAEVAAMQEPAPPEAVSVLRDLRMARFAMLAADLGATDTVSAAVAAYNRATRVLNGVTEKAAVLPPLRG